MPRFFKRLWNASPLAWIAFAALAGIYLAEWVGRGTPLGFALLFGTLTVASAVWFLREKGSPAALLALSVAAFGLAHLLTVAADRTTPLLDKIEDGQQLYVEAEGVVDDLPAAAGEDGSDEYIVPLRLGWVREMGTDKILPANVRVRLLATGPRPLYGDRLRIRGFYAAPKSPRNPGEFDTRKHLRMNGMLADLRSHDAGSVRLLGTGQGNAIVALAYQSRQEVELILTRGLEDRPVAAATLKAMVLGDREDTPQEIEESFRRSGTMHIFAVSGLHVGILALIAGQALALVGLPRRYAALAVIPIVLYYAFVTGFRPSAVRAAIMASIWFLGISLGRKPVLMNTLGAAALIILASNTFYALQGGFQLSFLVVASIALLARPIQKPIRRFIDPDPFIPKILLSNGQKGWHGTLQRCADTVSVSMAAWTGSAIPILLYFHILTPIALIANCFLIPLAVGILGLGAASILFSVLFLSFLSTPANRANAHLADATTWLATTFAEVPYGHFFVEIPSIPPEPSPKLTVFDLSRGGAARHLSLGGRNGDWLFDCGDEGTFSGTVRSGLRARGVDSVAGLFLSHNDVDHIGGAAALYREIPTRRTIESVPGGGSVNIEAKAAADAADTRSLHLQAGDSIHLTGSKSDAIADILYPPGDGYARIADDRSAVIMITCRGWKILLMGDAGFHTEKWLLAQTDIDLRCDVLVKNWHASDASGLPEFLEATSPRAIVASNGNRILGAFIPEPFRETARALDIPLIDQAETGAVTILLGEETLELRPFLDSAAGLTLPRHTKNPAE